MLFSNTQLPLTSSPVNCKHAPFQATSLQNDGVRRSKWRSGFISLIFGQATSLQNDGVRRSKWRSGFISLIFGQATSLQNDGVRRSEERSWLINLLCCLWSPHFSWPVNCKLQLGLLCTVSWDYQHCTWIKKSLGGTCYLPSKWGTETEHIKILVKRLICCFLTSHFPWPLYL